MVINSNQNSFLSTKIGLVLLVASLWALPLAAQETSLKPVSFTERNTIIDSISALVARYYIDPEIGKKIVNHIASKHKKGNYSSLTDPAILADSLTSDLRAINGDLHMSMMYKAPRKQSTKDKGPIEVNSSGIWSNYGLSQVSVLQGNIGYLKIKHFTRHNYLEAIKPAIKSSFELLQHTDAIVVDVRDNGGGFEEMVAHYISYFFDLKKPIHLSDYRCTLHNHTYGISTDPKISGPKLPKTKVYVLVNAHTGSAAESFAYVLKHLQRATIIGETTAGAGNGASEHEINSRFSLLLSSEETINAITKTSFEKVGVIPHIKTTSKEAYNEAYKLALTHAKDNNTRNIHPSNYDRLLAFIASPKDTALAAETYQEYPGNYKGDSIEIIISLEDNVLYGQLVGKGGKMELTPLGNHIFKVGELMERIQFILDASNKVAQLKGLDSPMELLKVTREE